MGIVSSRFIRSMCLHERHRGAAPWEGGSPHGSSRSAVRSAPASPDRVCASLYRSFLQ